jgi:hypothetical protein
MRLLYKTPIAAFLVLWMGSWAVASGADSPPPDREMLRMMDLLRDMEMIKQIDMLQEMPNLEQRDTTAKSASAQKPLPAKQKESAK